MHLFNGPCPKCGGDVKVITPELHPTDKDKAVLIYECPKCGAVPKTVSIGTDKSGEPLK